MALTRFPFVAFILLVKLHCFVGISSRHDPECHARSRYTFVILEDIFKTFRIDNTQLRILYRKQHVVFRNVSITYRNEFRRRKAVCIAILILCGDIESNPGPLFCKICELPVFDHHLTISCTDCERKYHSKCVKTALHNQQSVFHVIEWYCQDCSQTNKQCVQYRKRKSIMIPRLSVAKKSQIWQEHSYSRLQVTVVCWRSFNHI